MDKQMKIQRAEKNDIEDITNLLHQVLGVHHMGRPDLFKGNTTKYNEEELLEIIEDDKRPIFVAKNEEDRVVGYAFCIFERHENNSVRTDISTLYIDDLCVDENQRNGHIGRSLYDYVVNHAKESGCYNVTLNVWSCNESAMKFYEKCGLIPYKVGMEKIL